MKTIQTITEDPGKRRVVIFQRDDGSFGFEAEYFSDDRPEMAWLPSGSGSRCGTLLPGPGAGSGGWRKNRTVTVIKLPEREGSGISRHHF